MAEKNDKKNTETLLSDRFSEELESFLDYLTFKQLSAYSIQYYMQYIRHINLEEFEKNPQRGSLSLLKKYNNNVCRAAILNFSEFKNVNVKLPKITGRKKKTIPKVLSYKQRKAFRLGMYYLEYEAGILFDLMYFGALRREEALTLRWSDFIDLDMSKLKKAEPCRLRIKGKGNRERIVIIPAEIIANLKQFVLMKKAKNKIPKKNDYIFSYNYPVRINHIFSKVNKALSMKVNPHLIRHTRATDIYNSHENIYHLRDYLGHSSVLTTELYVHPDREKILKAIEEITAFD